MRFLTNLLVALALAGLGIAPAQAGRVFKPNQLTVLKGAEPKVPAAGVTVTWNPSDKSTYATLSNGNLTITGLDFNERQGARSSEYKTTGKWCFYVQHVSAGVSDEFFLGVASENLTITPFLELSPGTTDVAGIRARIDTLYDAFYYYNGYVNDVATGALTSTDWAGTCFDADNDLVWFGKNGSWVGDPAAGTGGRSTPAFTRYYAYAAVLRDDQLTAHFSATSPPYAPPSGFSMLGS